MLYSFGTSSGSVTWLGRFIITGAIVAVERTALRRVDTDGLPDSIDTGLAVPCALRSPDCTNATSAVAYGRRLKRVAIHSIATTGQFFWDATTWH